VLHSNTQGLIDHWRGLRGEADVPPRAALEPADISDLLAQVFIVGRDSPALPFRLAGALLVDLNGGGLRGASFLDQWSPSSRAAARDAVAAAVRDREPLVIYAETTTAQAAIGFEILLAPLTGPGGRIDRLLGLYQPLSSLSVLRGEPIRPFTHRLTLRLPDAAPRRASHLRLVAVNGASV
jgi:hypothetical protein